jgi:hypothetical protein
MDYGDCTMSCTTIVSGGVKGLFENQTNDAYYEHLLYTVQGSTKIWPDRFEAAKGDMKLPDWIRVISP